uniref:Eukaryotic translation initiation factor 4E binding protein 2 n=4 Tax=Laurasiatheria TaxID=314145 RepID=A0A7N5JP14_AILME
PATGKKARLSFPHLPSLGSQTLRIDCTPRRVRPAGLQSSLPAAPPPSYRPAPCRFAPPLYVTSADLLPRTPSGSRLPPLPVVVVVAAAAAAAAAGAAGGGRRIGRRRRRRLRGRRRERSGTREREEASEEQVERAQPRPPFRSPEAAGAARAPSRRRHRRRPPARPPDKARDPAPRAMSSSSGSGHQPSQSRAIPTRTVPISDAAQLPHDYCTTPGGTLFSTTPGGTRIIYDRKFLLDRRNSPMAQTPPCHLPNIPGVTSPGTLIEDSKVEVNNLNNLNNHDRKHAVGDDAQFEMDI